MWVYNQKSTFLCTKVYTKLFYKLTHTNVYQMYTNLWMSATYTLMCMQMCTFGTQFLWECTEPIFTKFDLGALLHDVRISSRLVKRFRFCKRSISLPFQIGNRDRH